MHKRIGLGLIVAALWFSFAAIAATPAPPMPVEAQFAGTKALWLDFAEPMQTWGNEVRGDLVRTTPALAMTCTWDSDTRLACRFDHGNAAEATRYRVDIAGGLKTQSDTLLPPIAVHSETVRPQLTATIARWRDGVPEVELAANMPISAASARAALRLSVGDIAIPVPLLRPLPPSWPSDKRTRFALALPAIDGFDRMLTLRIVPGLRARPGPLPGTQDETLLRILVNERFALRGIECAGRNGSVRAQPQVGVAVITCTPGELIQLVFPRPMDAASRTRLAQTLSAGVRVLDWKPKHSDGTGFHRSGGIATTPSSRLELEMTAPHAEAIITLDASLKADDGTSLQPARIHLRTGNARPQLRARHARALIANGRALPILVEAVNSSRTAVDVRSLGARARSEALRTPEHRDSAPLTLGSKTTTEALGEDGWVRWTPASEAPIPRYSRAPRSIDFAAPAFDLYAVAGRREVLAWANEWDRDAAIAGAEVELLWRDSAEGLPRVVARAQTGDDGVALLQLPDDVVVPELDDDVSSGPLWLLRATKGMGRDAERAVLPLGEPQAWGLILGKALPRKTWGVSDRPMYRVGESVSYRLWQRDLGGGHLLAVRSALPVKMQLRDEYREKVILEWQATPSQDGGIAGALTLPIHLTDATYCIGVGGKRGDTEGACFFVGTYRAQDLWAEVKSSGGVLRDGQRFVVDLTAGYYSGGMAAGAGIEGVDVLVEPLPLEEAYPQYAAFRFVDVGGDDIETPSLKGFDGEHVLGLEGALRIDVPVAFDGTPVELAHRPAFGTLYVGTEVSPDDREGTTAWDETTRYARFERYVGLKTDPVWFDASSPIGAEAIVIDAEGRAIADAEIEVEIDYLAGFDDASGPLQRLARCTLHAQTPAPCDFPRAKSGRYRLTARSGDAAPTELIRYVWVGDDALRGKVDEAELTVLDRSPQRDVPLRVLMRQPHASGRVLFVIGGGEAILGHRVEAVTGNVQGYALPVSPQWRGALELHAHVRETLAPPPKDGYRIPADVRSLQASVPAAAIVPVAAPVTVRFEPGNAIPGATVQITVRNDTSRPRDVVLAVMDDALRSLAQRWLRYADPMGSEWLDVLQRPSSHLFDVGFNRWNDEPWSLLLPWPHEAAAAVHPGPPDSLVAPAPADEYSETGGSDSTTLDRIQVTGSRIKRVDVEASAPTFRLQRFDEEAIDPETRTRESEAPRGSSNTFRELARVRTHFADTALWVPDIRLMPGESRTIDLELPDNLTRWRAVVWSGDSGDDFAMTDATLETGLPLEVRLQTPVRIYPGDRARLATSVRQTGETAVVAGTELHIEGAGTPIDEAKPLPLGPRGQASVATTIAPDAVGLLQVTASAETPAGRDAVAAALEVASPLIAARKLQAGWLGATPLVLDLPVLPSSARDPQLQVTLLRGSAGLVGGWTQDLRDYPHRCWEQILSRGVAAALALERNDASWPEAKAVVQEALDNAAAFQDENGGFRYFVDAGSDGWATPDSSVALTAYTLRAFGLLRELGHPVSERIETEARGYLAEIPSVAPDQRARDANAPETTASANNAALALFAFAAAARDDVERTQLDALWSRWHTLPLPAQIEATRALAVGQHPGAADAMTRLLANAPVRGSARVLRLPRRYDQWMSSDLSEQCGLVELLRDFPELAEPATRHALIAGMTDLYAGGVAAVDTQTGAACLMALRDLAGIDNNTVAAAQLDVGTTSTELRLAAGEQRVEWNAGAPDASQLRIATQVQGSSPISFVAELRYLEDAREARAAAMGFSIERHYAVLRGAAWEPVAAQTLRQGDWIRISLVIETSAPRQFVAVTDAVPGGLRPTDLSLSGVAGRDLERVSNEGSDVFTTRKLDPRSPRFYAEALPSGRHELHYFALVGNSGDYLAAPATAELMYGNASSARTAATRLRIESTTE